MNNAHCFFNKVCKYAEASCRDSTSHCPNYEPETKKVRCYMDTLNDLEDKLTIKMLRQEGRI